jgi:DNA-binding response OmpR family regulator
MAKILVVDDEERIRNLFHDILSWEGIEVFTASDKEGCLGIAQEELPDLILLDVVIPGADGGQIARDLSENEKTKNIPVIFLTGLISEEEVVKRRDGVGGRAFLSKFSDIKEITKKVKEALAIGK